MTYGRGYPITLEVKQKIHQLFLEGVNVQALAERFSVSYTTAYILAKAKVRKNKPIRRKV